MRISCTAKAAGLTQMHLSTAENIDRMRRSRNLYSLVLGGSLCLFGMYFLLFAVFQGEIKYVFLAVICALLACATRISMCCICCLQITTGQFHIGFWC